ncbi:MAG TPA: TlpA disulfide reductase family protein [Pyrinomonadaceae bacterium]|nr:TlpA disulfide reductase family protein [Pyrinomonadaceae bacterium]
MDSAPEIHANETLIGQEPQTLAALDRAFELRGVGQLDAAKTELEKALDRARLMPGETDFRDRVELAMTLADFYKEAGTPQKAREVLAAEVSYAEEEYRKVRATGTPTEKREVMTGLTVLRDHHAQIALIGQTAPEISVKHWINSDPITLTDLRGYVVLLEFWATWCKPCQRMFPKIKELYQDYAARGLRVLALTRHYFADRANAGSQESELELIRGYVRDHGLEFPVGVAEDARTQLLYGAVGVPVLALLDRQGVVRCYGHFDADHSDPEFDEVLRRCLDEPA